jgi:hypothetical protein
MFFLAFPRSLNASILVLQRTTGGHSCTQELREQRASVQIHWIIQLRRTLLLVRNRALATRLKSAEGVGLACAGDLVAGL